VKMPGQGTRRPKAPKRGPWRAAPAKKPETGQAVDFVFNFHYGVPATELFAALGTRKGIQGWWTRFCRVSARSGGRSEFRFPSAGFSCAMRTVRREPPRVLEWRCIECQHPPQSGYADLSDWVGTRIRFEVSPIGKGESALRFSHLGLVPLECGAQCGSIWSEFLSRSLRGYLEKGRGDPCTE
jgi:uncharacterized protein YndB with AHSA1/START domain